MKKVLLAMTAASALCVGVPANAQVGDIIGGIFGGGGDYDSRIRQLENRIQNGIRRGTISRGEGDRLWNLLQDIRARENYYDDGGFSREERYDLDRRLADLDRRIAAAERGGNGGYANGGGYGNGGYGGGGWYPGGGNDSPFDDRIRDLRDRIEQGVRSGRLTADETRYLRGQLNVINRLESQYDNDGFSRSERDALRNRLDRLRSDLENALRNGAYRNRDNWNDRGCPPGLVRKNNGCLPPGQAKNHRDHDRYDHRRDRDDDDRDDDHRRERDDD